MVKLDKKTDIEPGDYSKWELHVYYFFNVNISVCWQKGQSRDIVKSGKLEKIRVSFYFVENE